jgi:succinate dehydrogenase / fumarate reductase cytochrome b subunit
MAAGALAPRRVLTKGNAADGAAIRKKPAQSLPQAMGIFAKMASADKVGARSRPLSPHLQIWRWGPAMLVSILHRVTGGGLSLVGLGILLWWLGALASGPAAYDTFAGHMGAWYGQIVLVGLTWAFFQHLCSGIRHYVLDIGAGYELEANARWSVVTIVIALLLTAAFWAFILVR